MLTNLSDEITRNEIDYVTNFEISESLFYGLPKIHKSSLINNECLNNTSYHIQIIDPKDLKFRPKVAGSSCETHILGSKMSVHFVFGHFPLPIMLNVHVFGTKIKIRTCTL